MVQPDLVEVGAAFSQELAEHHDGVFLVAGQLPRVADEHGVEDVGQMQRKDEGAVLVELFEGALVGVVERVQRVVGGEGVGVQEGRRGGLVSVQEGGGPGGGRLIVPSGDPLVGEGAGCALHGVVQLVDGRDGGLFPVEHAVGRDHEDRESQRIDAVVAGRAVALGPGLPRVAEVDTEQLAFDLDG